ncbi:sulfotransferase family protein [Lichenicoccus sp.]|uniref:sulfotransferase family protein n=1 Tax=Lichenicoccus sp. TaxID=2781899 RepID=UPI003D0F0382
MTRISGTARRIHCISGLPRSGSTLLASLLRQNPRLRAEMSSPVAVLCERVLPVMGQGEYATCFDDNQRRRILLGLFEHYYAAVPTGITLFDTNRVWCARMRLVADLHPGACVIACVRDPVWILDSFERLLRRNTYLVSKLHGLAHSVTVFDRVEQLMSAQGAFGAAWNALQDAYFGEHAHRLILIDYDELTAQPLEVLTRLYKRLGLAPFAHDLGNVGYDGGHAFDAALNTPGLHAVRDRVERLHRRTILPPQIVRRLAGTTFWRDPKQNPGGALVIAPG